MDNHDNKMSAEGAKYLDVRMITHEQTTTRSDRLFNYVISSYCLLLLNFSTVKPRNFSLNKCVKTTVINVFFFAIRIMTFNFKESEFFDIPNHCFFLYQCNGALDFLCRLSF